MYFSFSRVNLLRIVGISLCMMLSACDSSKSNSKQLAGSDQNHPSTEITQSKPDEPASSDGRNLADVAGQATLPEIKKLDQNNTISKKAEAFVGRYHTEINCEDPFAMCEHGSSEFIINLLPDGTAHRTIVYMGRVTVEKNEKAEAYPYQKNTWIYDDQNNQIVVNRKEGIQFFYHVDAHNNLVMDIDKILNGTEENRRYFSQHNIAPTKNYVMEKFDH